MITAGNLLAVAIGGGVGSVLRWLVSIWLNPVTAAIPLGTLAVNTIGGFGMGFALGAFLHWPALSSEFRVLVASGFFGGLTTFSAFSAEVVVLFTSGRIEWGLATVLANVLGAIAMTFLGLKVFQMVAS